MDQIRKIVSELTPQDAYNLLRSMEAAIEAEQARNGVSPKVVLYHRYKALLVEYLRLILLAERQFTGDRQFEPAAAAQLYTSFPEFRLCLDMDKPCGTVGFLFTDLLTGTPTDLRFSICSQ